MKETPMPDSAVVVERKDAGFLVVEFHGRPMGTYSLKDAAEAKGFADFLNGCVRARLNAQVRRDAEIADRYAIGIVPQETKCCGADEAKARFERAREISQAILSQLGGEGEGNA